MRSAIYVSVSARERDAALDGSGEDLTEIRRRVRRLSVLSCDEIAVEDAIKPRKVKMS